MTLPTYFNRSALSVILASALLTVLAPSMASAQNLRGSSTYILQAPKPSPKVPTLVSPTDNPTANSEPALDTNTDSGIITRSDPLGFINRPVFYFNDIVDTNILKPVSKTYVEYVPSSVRQSVGNFFQNLREPGNVLNYTLQGNPELLGVSASRFLTNTTAGIGGLFDVAILSNSELSRHNTTFGSTLSRWGVPAGAYLVLPILGPSNLRDTTALLAVDVHTKPQNYLGAAEQTPTLIVESVSTRAQYLRAGDMLDDAIIGERYTFIKNAYEQRVSAEQANFKEDRED